MCAAGDGKRGGGAAEPLRAGVADAPRRVVPTGAPARAPRRPALLQARVRHYPICIIGHTGNSSQRILSVSNIHNKKNAPVFDCQW